MPACEYGATSQLYRRYEVNQFATNRAADIALVLGAGDRYARKNETAILNKQPAAGFADPLAPTMDELQKGCYLGSAFTDVSQRGGPIKLTITLEPVSCVGAKCQMAVRAYPGGGIRDVDGRPDPPWPPGSRRRCAVALAGAICRAATIR